VKDTACGARVAILALPESSASVIYGMYDLFMSAGRDWGLIVDGAPGRQVMNPVVVSSHEQPFRAGNGVLVARSGWTSRSTSSRAMPDSKSPCRRPA
jgi:hypothetical protein